MDYSFLFTAAKARGICKSVELNAQSEEVSSKKQSEVSGSSGVRP